MSHIRSPVRRTLTRGSIVHATVEQFQLGLATVRLATNGARLTNLSTIGGEVAVGDGVLVDYSAGIKPIVRPLFFEEDDVDEFVELTPVEKVESSEILGGCFGWHRDWIEPEIWLQHGQPYTYHIGPETNRNFSHSNAFWEDGDFGVTDRGGWWGLTYFTIPRDGKYLLHGGVKEDHWDHEPPYGGWYRLRIWLNGSTLIGEVYSPCFTEQVFGPSSLNCTMIQEFVAGDKISFDYTFTIPEGPYWLDDTWSYAGESHDIMIQLLPGTGVTDPP